MTLFLVKVYQNDQFTRQLKKKEENVNHENKNDNGEVIIEMEYIIFKSKISLQYI